MDVAERRVAASLRVLDGVDGEQRRLGLDVVDVLGIGNAGVLHRRAHALGDLLHHRRAADVLRLDRRAHGDADDEARLVGRAGLVVAGEDGGMGGNDAIAAA